jgi:hypothetical protein
MKRRRKVKVRKCVEAGSKRENAKKFEAMQKIAKGEMKNGNGEQQNLTQRSDVTNWIN